MNTFLFVIAIFFSVWWGFINFAKLFRCEAIPALNIIVMSAGFTAVITHIIGIW